MQNKDYPRLLNCPFCGGIPAVVEDGYKAIAVHCFNCGADITAESEKKARAAWNRRAQPANEPCADCSGMVYRQTASGKIIPADAKCAVIEPPPCYQPDNDGCAYQIYGDNDDEPIDKCKACPLCYSDKVRHNANEPLPDHIGDVTEMVPLTLEQLKQMDGEPVWCADGEGHSCYCLVNAESEDCIDSECGAWCFEFYGMTGDGENGLHNMGWLAYDHKLGGEQE